ncbi:MAG TPA: hypothetical protein VIZ28_05025 [Chitinophagaceae bacterium]
MRSFSILLISGILFLQTCAINGADESSLIKKEKPVQEKTKIDFEKQVLPVMVKNCSPCHFTGGKMYERLPFDKDTTIINHGERILNRIKKDDENTLLKAFFDQKKS